MQAAGNLVSSAAELAARMQDGQAYLDRRTADLGVNADREAASIVMNGAGTILFKGNDDLGTEAIRKLKVKDFPVIVVIDSQGNDLYETAIAEYRREV